VDLKLSDAGLPPGVTRGVAGDLAWLADIAEKRKPFSAITHCFCRQP
jgi:protease-4